MERLLLYDRKRKPPNWMDIVRPGQYAVFLSEVESSSPTESDGTPVSEAAQYFCLRFDSLTEAEGYCREAVAKTRRLQCEVFDSHGRVNPPVAVFVHPDFSHKLDTEASGQRLISGGAVAVAISVPLFIYAVVNDASVVWWPILVGINFAIAGLRFIQWGYGVKEEIRYQRSEAERRLRETAARAASPNC